MVESKKREVLAKFQQQVADLAHRMAQNQKEFEVMWADYIKQLEVELRYLVGLEE